MQSLGSSFSLVLAGCAASENGSPPDHEEPDGRQWYRVTPVGHEVVELSDGPIARITMDVLPAGFPFDNQVAGFRPPTESRPAALTISVRNISSRSQTLQVDRQSLPFLPGAARSSSNHRSALVLGGKRNLTSRDGCWMKEQEYITQALAIDTRTLEPSTELSQEYALVNHVQNEACWPAGEYRFEQQYRVNPNTAEGFTYVWGFAVIVEAPAN